MEILQNALILIGRICIASLYIWAAAAKVFNWKGTIEYMQSKNFPLISFMLPAAVVLQIGGGLLLVFGYYCRVGATILILFTIPAMIKMHDFWHIKDQTRILEKTFFMKDIAILGGLLIILAFGPGAFSADVR
jgi:putative oxidoreductase